MNENMMKEGWGLKPTLEALPVSVCCTVHTRAYYRGGGLGYKCVKIKSTNKCEGIVILGVLVVGLSNMSHM
jgi:hypothetical protein